MNKFFKLFLSIFLLLSFTGCSTPSNASSNEPLKRTELLMGTTVSITLFDHQTEETLDAAFNLVKNLENELSLNKSSTLLTQLNASSGTSPYKVNSTLFDIVEKGLYYSQLTNGSFDLSVGPLVKLWSIGLPEARVPSQTEIDATLPLIGYQNITLNKEDSSIYLHKPSMQLDLGGIAKGYTADAIATLLSSKGVGHALIDLGGNIYTLGAKIDGSLWKVGIQDPFESRSNIVGYVSVANQSVVTSGIYERYLEADGNKYHHILNPQTGYPFENDIAGISIISDTSIDGDALSTAVFSQGLEEGMAFVQTLPGIDAIFITKDSQVYITEGLKNSFVLTNEAFTLVE
ncbi:MAG: FAD:protein FMN transferase [Niameybacter sp.]